jgi:hypothetical protein
MQWFYLYNEKKYISTYFYDIVLFFSAVDVDEKKPRSRLEFCIFPVSAFPGTLMSLVVKGLSILGFGTLIGLISFRKLFIGDF